MIVNFKRPWPRGMILPFLYKNVQLSSVKSKAVYRGLTVVFRVFREARFRLFRVFRGEDPEP